MSTPPDLTGPADLRARLERAVGEPPSPAAHPDPRAVGRRVVRRRRVGAVVAAVVAVVAVAGAATLGGGPGRDPGRVQVADDPAAPSPSSTPTSTPTAAPVVPTVPAEPTPSTVRLPTVPVPGTDPAGTAPLLDADRWADYRADGALVLLPDVTVVQRTDDPIAADEQSVALHLSRPGEVDRLYVVEIPPGWPTSIVTWTPVGGEFATLEAWVEHLDQPLVDPPFPATGAEDGDLVRRGDDGVLTPGNGVQILEQRSGVDVGAAFAPAADTDAALVTRGGRRFFVLVRPSYDSVEVVRTTPARAGGATDLDGFLAWARERWADDRGPR
jgi:hypothetical protein